MRQLYTIFLTAILFLAACKKDATPIPTIYAQWQWEYSTPDLTGNGNGYKVTPSANTTVVLTLNADGVYTIQKNAQEVLRDKFQVITAGNVQQITLSHFTPVDQLAIFTPNPTISLSGNKLQITDIIDKDNVLMHYFK